MVEIINSSHNKVHSENNYKNSPKFNKKYLAITLITLLLGGYLTYKITKETTKKKEDIYNVFIDKKIGTYSQTIKEIKIDDNDNDSIEGDRYKTFFEYYCSAQKEINKLKNKNIELLKGEDLGIERFLPLVIKEARLKPHEKSATGAYGYFQLMGPAIDDINKLFKDHNIDYTQYNPNNDPADNILYGILYFLKNKKEFEKENPSINKNDADKFVFASYNAGLTKVQKLLKMSNASSWDDFVKYIIKNMGLDGSYKEKESAYKVKYRNFFDKDYTKDTDIIINKNNTTLTKHKAQQMINYAEVIIAIKKAVDDAIGKLTLYKSFDKTNGTLFDLFINKKNTGELKLKDGVLLGNLINEILLDNNIDPKGIPDTLRIYLSNQLIGPYIDTNPYSKYDTIPYKDGYYLGKIVKEKLQDANFQKNVINKIDYLKDIQKDGDVESQDFVKFVINNAIINFNIKYRIGRAPNSSDDVWIPTDVKYYKDYIDETQRAADETKKIDEEEGTETSDIIISHSDIYKAGETIINEDNMEITQTSYEKFIKTKVKKINSEITTKDSKMSRGERSKSINKMPNIFPKYIILHSTAGIIHPSRINKVTAHFFVNKAGEIFMLVAEDGSLRQINHAGRSKDPNFNAIRAGNKNITFESIGIEVEALGGEDWTLAEYTTVKELICNLGRKYKIKKNHVLTHQQVATSIFGRGRKTDPYNIQRKKLGLPENYGLIDKDIASGNCMPNTLPFIAQLKEQGCSDFEIQRIFQGIDASIELARKSGRKLTGNLGSRRTSKEILEVIRKGGIKKSIHKEKNNKEIPTRYIRQQKPNDKVLNRNEKKTNKIKKTKNKDKQKSKKGHHKNRK